MSKPRVYLAGSIGGLSYAAATEWRVQARDSFSKSGIDAFSPMRGKDFLSGEDNLTWLMDHWKQPMATSKGIMCRDYNDCISADVILVNLKGVSRPSMGTVMEIAWGFHARIPVVLIAEEDNIHVTHPMLVEAANFRVDTLEEGIKITKHILLPEGNG